MAGYFAIGIEGAKNETNIGTLWRSASLLGASFVFTVGRRYKHQGSDTMKAVRHLPLLYFDTVDDLYTHLPAGCVLVGLELELKAIPLTAFSHPKQAVYLLGAEDLGISQQSMERCHTLVKLPGERSMNVAVVGSIVMYDRLAKTEHGPKRVSNIGV